VLGSGVAASASRAIVSSGAAMHRGIAMETIILVPGGGGTRLKLKSQEIWPPTLTEYAFGYNRTAELQDSRVKPTKVIDAIPSFFPCYEVYKPLQDDLDKIAKYSQARRVDFAYDWRKDVIGSANQLASKIASCVSGGSTSITLVCHSMGNLLARMILESGDYSSKSWFNKITRYVGICGPHFGVPRILDYALGLKDWLGISPSNMKIVSANPKYPGCYQCLPFVGKQALWDVHSGTPVAKDFYTPAVASAFDLNLQNINAAKNLQSKLNFSNKPPGAQYFLIAGSDLTTDEGIEFNGTAFKKIRTDYLGDSTIPLWSSAISQFNPQVTPGDHVAILKSYPFKVILYEILTGGALPPDLTLADQPGLTLSLSDFSFAPDDQIEVIIIPDLSTQKISGTLNITRVVDREGKKFVRYREQPVEYLGPQIRVIRSTISAPADPGIYRMTFDGSHGTSQRTFAAFVVSKQSTRRQR
jgi:Lecithin:cholesterol acyltransferase